jgi:hypothetical protein
MFSRILKRAFFILQVIAISIYLVFEELIWDRFAQPIFKYIKHLRFFKRLEIILNGANRYVVLALFILPFIVGEALGIMSPIVALKGYVLLGIVLYILKLLIVAFAFWLFNIQKEKLLSFSVIKYCYDKIVEFTTWVKTTDAFKTISKIVQKSKTWLKIRYANLKTFIKRYM